MDQQFLQVLLWILGTAVVLLTAVLGFIFRMMLSHNKDCNARRIADAEHRGATDAKLERILQDIGDHKSGLRGALHDLREYVSPFVIRAQLDEERNHR